MRGVNEVLQMTQEHAQAQQIGITKAQTNLDETADTLDVATEEMKKARQYRRGWYDRMIWLAILIFTHW